VDVTTMAALGKVGGAMALFFSALGSCLGVGAAGPAAIGSWKKCYLQNKAAPFVLVTFVGAPLSQTIYGMILMNQMAAKLTAGASVTAEQLAVNAAAWPAMLGIGLFGGVAMGLSAWIQGRIGASASDAMAETGKGFGNYLMALGIIETVALFVMVFIGGLL
jgi:V/A-type H+-transporting ATPase subunit K